MLKTLLIIIIALSLNTIAKADPSTNCNPIIQACDAALLDKQKQIDIRDLRIKTDEEQVTLLTKTVQDRDNELSAFYRNPFFLMALGLVTGIVITK